ncbi:helix-turn-helix domain-containing protein [Massilia sp. CFBP9012]|uniref:helix-turn-helix transcriptional regulator n=1 Tax=Massilia sp. CFBP9012 TaxID=3096531 RepID=UPI002A6A58CB|nr:helix-turn-helix domain-containing protein [Massilia sp. CFBP9012]MDY0976531.1 helix-turn-helix domain-containing protein [Massilia sp. CFBP9012]
MSRRKPIDKTQIRERRNRMLESAAAARLSLTEGVREMRAISGMTQEDFARHRGVSARVIKALELGQGNPTMATMNRIGQFFGLEVAFVPVMSKAQGDVVLQPADDLVAMASDDAGLSKAILVQLKQDRDNAAAGMHELAEAIAEFKHQMKATLQELKQTAAAGDSTQLPGPGNSTVPDDTATTKPLVRARKKPRSP